MENKPTEQYLDYLISKYTDTPDTGTSRKAFNILQLNIQSEFQHSASSQAIQTNRCAKDNMESNNSI